MNQTPESPNRIRIGITHGDVNGINYEIIIKTMQDQRLFENYTVIVYGSSKVASYHRKIIDANDFNFNLIRRADQAHARRPNIINLTEEEVKLDTGKSTPVAGELALQALEMAVSDLKNNHIDVLVTAPINKKNIQSPGFAFPGHTEYLAGAFNAPEHLMLMVTRAFRIGVATGHLPLSGIPAAITTDLLVRKIRLMNQSLIRDFGIIRPRIAVLALNPHAGDEGVIGDEDQRIVAPAISQVFMQNILAFGPFPADGFFGSSAYREFDGVLALYHDQGMIPFKLLSFEEGVNFTAGLPYVRTSPAHGTAYDIAGKNQASPEAFRNALYMACDILQNRRDYDQLHSNPLKPAQNAAEPASS